MPVCRIVTVNILSDLSRWEARRAWLATGLAETGADLIACQEVNLEINTATWLAERLEYPYLHLTPKTGRAGRKEGLAILSRLPFENRADLDLGSQNRVAQRVEVRFGGQMLGIANGHFYWQPGESVHRLQQVQRLLDWLKPLIETQPVIVCGDFNSGPKTTAIAAMRRGFRSAYAERHGREPDFTAPTPLPRSKIALLRTLLAYWREIRLNALRRDWRETLDYIFVNERIGVRDCRLILDRPAPGDARLYASDHFGLFAEVEFQGE